MKTVWIVYGYCIHPSLQRHSKGIRRVWIMYEEYVRNIKIYKKFMSNIFNKVAQGIDGYQ